MKNKISTNIISMILLFIMIAGMYVLFFINHSFNVKAEDHIRQNMINNYNKKVSSFINKTDEFTDKIKKDGLIEEAKKITSYSKKMKISVKKKKFKNVIIYKDKIKNEVEDIKSTPNKIIPFTVIAEKEEYEKTLKTIENYLNNSPIY